MITRFPQRPVSALRPLAAWAGAVTLTLGALFGASSATAAPPPALAKIGNVATMTYTDTSGLTISTQSNEVQTEVQQVGSFTLDGFSTPTTTVQNNKTGAGATTVYAPHVVTNTGNDVDGFKITLANMTSGPGTGSGTFSKVELFADANNDGLPDSTTSLCSSAGPTLCSAGFTQTIAGNGGTFPFVVAYTIPGGAPAGVFASELVTATPVATARYTAPNTSASDVDTVNVTIIEAFSATKSIGAPAVKAPGNVAWPTANTSGPSSGAACPATFPVTQSATCDYTVYTINYKNNGAAAGAFFVHDVLPAGFTYVTGSAVWSGASGVALGEGAGGDPAGINFDQSGQTLSALVGNVLPNVSGTLSFVVLVKSTALVGTTTTTNTATYDEKNSTKASGATGDVSTNPAPFTVTATFGVVLGSATGTAAGSIDTTPGTPNGTALDLNTQASATAGSGVNFTQTLFNTGNASDTFNLTVSTAIASTYPAGTTFAFYAADGSTPLLDTNGDGIPDTGSVAGAGTSKTFVVKANIPSSATAGSGPFSVVVLATSIGDSTKFDASKDTLTKVTGILVDLTNTPGGTGSGSVGNGDAGQGPSPLPTTTLPTAAGTGAVFNLFVKNNDTTTTSQTYTLASSNTTSFPGSMPAGWTVKFIATGAGCAGTAITTLNVLSGLQGSYDACVTPPASAPVNVTTNVFFRVTSTTNALAVDTKTDAVNVNSAAQTFSAVLTPSNSGSVAPGGTVVYAHTLNATGGQSCGTYKLSVVGNTAGNWSYSLFIDGNGDGKLDPAPTDTPIDSTTVNPALLLGTPQKILVKVFAPGGAVAGAQDTATVTATFDPANGGTCALASNTDTSTVVTGLMRGDKTQALDAACDGVADTAFSAVLIKAKPGQCVIYQVVAVNQGTSPVTNLSVNDTAPGYTHLLGATQPTPAAACVAGSGTSTVPVVAITGDSVKCGPAATVMPGGTLTLTFAVKIDQ